MKKETEVIKTPKPSWNIMVNILMYHRHCLLQYLKVVLLSKIHLNKSCIMTQNNQHIPTVLEELNLGCKLLHTDKTVYLASY